VIASKTDAPHEVRSHELKRSLVDVSHMAYGALEDIRLLCFLTLNHLESPGELSDAETAAQVLEMIQVKAEEVAAAVSAEAESVGIVIEQPRRDRRRAALRRIFAPGEATDSQPLPPGTQGVRCAE
jgi:hypothetical protein